MRKQGLTPIVKLNYSETMITIDTHEAKTRLSALLAKIEAGEGPVTICRNGKPVAELRSPSLSAPDPLGKHPKLKPIYVAPDYDPVMPLLPADWPEALR